MSNEMNNKLEGADAWKKVMSTVLTFPGVKVNREKFLRSELAIWCNREQIEKAVTKFPHAAISKEIIDRIADSCRKSHTYKVTAASTAAGLPGGPIIVLTMPTDVAQYYWHTFVLAQKLAYLYGWPDLCDEEGNLTDTACDTLTIFVGVMMGVAVANQAIREVAKGFAGQVVKRLPRMALTKGTIYPLIKQIAKWIGVKITTTSFAKNAGKFIPILGGLTSGTITYIIFEKESKRLQRRLREDMQLLTES